MDNLIFLNLALGSSILWKKLFLRKTDFQSKYAYWCEVGSHDRIYTYLCIALCTLHTLNLYLKIKHFKKNIEAERRCRWTLKEEIKILFLKGSI
jgi:hypothetical protein